MTSVDNIEEYLKPLLLTNLNFVIEGKKIKSGKLLLFSIHDFFCTFTFFDSIKNKKTIYEIPYPFNIEKNGQNVIFDYTIDSLSKQQTIIHEILNNQTIKKPSKLFNKKLIISIHP